MRSMLNLTKNQASERNREPEERLFMYVIHQAVQDACYKGPYREYVFYKREAVEWFQNAARDFRLICTLSTFDPDYVNYKYKQAQKKGLVSYTDYQYELLYGKTKPVEKVKFTLKVKDEYF